MKKKDSELRQAPATQKKRAPNTQDFVDKDINFLNPLNFLNHLNLINIFLTKGLRHHRCHCFALWAFIKSQPSKPYQLSKPYKPFQPSKPFLNSFYILHYLAKTIFLAKV